MNDDTKKSKDELLTELSLLRAEIEVLTSHKKNYEKQIDLLSKSLLESAALKRALDESTIFNITNPDGKIIYVNDEFCRISKYAREELFGKTNSILNSGYHSDNFFQELWQTISRGDVWRGEIKNKAKDGSYFWVNTTIVPIQNKEGKLRYYLGIRSDITLSEIQKDLNDEWRQSFKHLLNTSGIIFVVLNSDQSVSMINKIGCQILGAEEKEIIGKNWFKHFVPEHYQRGTKSVFNKLIKGQFDIIEYYENPVITSGKDERMINWHNKVLRGKDGTIIGTLSFGIDITGSKLIERRLKENESRLQSILDTTIDGIILINNMGIVQSFNAASENIFGYRSNEIIGKNVSMLMPNPDRRNHDMFLKKFLKTRFKKIIGIGRDVNGIKKDGTVFPLHLGVSETIINDETVFVGIIRDLTEQRKAEDMALKFGQILDDSLNEIYIFDATSLKFIHVSQGALENIGYSINEITNLTPIDLKPKFNKTSFNATIRPLTSFKQDKITFITDHQRKNGSIYPVEVHLQMSEFRSQKVYIATILDITERLKAEEKLEKAREELMIQTLFTQRLSALATMAGGIAHELNQPLTSIKVYAETMKNYLTNDNLHKSDKFGITIDKIIGQVDRASGVINHMRDFSSEKKNVNDEFIVVRESIESVLELIGQQLRNHNIKFIDQVDSTLQLKMNKTRFEQVLINLISNAKDSIVVKPILGDEKREIIVKSEMTSKLFELILTDTGIGVSDQVRQNLFEPFVSTKKPNEGMGVGLSICHGILMDYGAKIQLNKTSLKGTVFSIQFPAKLTRMTYRKPIT